MEFVLQYHGHLPSASGKRKPAKVHHVRSEFHPQLRAFWVARLSPFIGLPPPSDPRWKDASEKHFEKNCARKGGFRFYPIVNSEDRLVCRLKIDLYRWEEPGSLILRGGDLDNRIKVLFDALSVPTDDQISRVKAGAEEDPFFCLLEDDKLIVGYSISSHQLWTPPDPQDQKGTFVNLAIRVRMASTRFSGGYGGPPGLPDL